MPRVALLALGALVILAGCLGGGNGGGPNPPAVPSGPTTDSGSPTPAPQFPTQTIDLLLAFEFAACRGLSVQHPRPLADVQALLPEGFVAAPPPDSSLEGTGVLAVDLFACGNLTTGGSYVPDTYVGQVYTYIERPVGLVPSAPDAVVQEYVFRLLAGEDILALLWPAAGYDTYNGTATVRVGPPLAGADALPRLGQGAVGSDYFLTATGVSAAGLGGGRTQDFARYTLLDDDSVLLWTGAYDFPAASTGHGVVEIADDDPFARYGAPGRPSLHGAAQQFDAGAMHGQDLRRVFPLG